jgi:hypothetical protein
MFSIAETISSVQHLLMPLLLVNHFLVNSVFSDTVQHACPSKCECEFMMTLVTLVAYQSRAVTLNLQKFPQHRLHVPCSR